MVKNVVSHTNKHLSKILGGAWGGTDLRPFWALPGCILNFQRRQLAAAVSCGESQQSLMADSRVKKRETDAHFLPICDTLITTNGYWPRGRTTELDIGSPSHSADPSRSTRIDCEPTRFTVVHCNPPFFGYCHQDWSFWVGNSLLKRFIKV